MTNILRNALLAAVAISGLAGSAMAGQQMTCGNTSNDKLWAGRCCGIHGANCLGGESHDHDRDRGRPA
ncbi:hypothetical protein [Mesorhizobium sp. B1-1-8]|uniref:hypothetical protein n=1 Tax=Mesorhizobium sp. B1-1-8 TaxID=2589976 RepID=UPI00112A45BF|nr:hypothetical protein [Mesorhizobium sp. B1-1-8]UCI08136.1 hypothetical protein FJ974_03425 [Mesorhizobium sp. B1-1-8]